MDLLTQASMISTLTQFKKVEVNTTVLEKLMPLWRVVLWGVALFALLVMAAAVRLDVQRLQMDFDRNDRMRGDAMVTHERLQMELDVRKRLGAVQGYSSAAELTHVSTQVLSGGQ